MRRVLPGAGAKRVLNRIDRLKADGGTDIYLGLRAGLPQLLREQGTQVPRDPDDRRHQPAAPLRRSCSSELTKHHITVGTVALGTHVDAALLRKASPPRRAGTPTRSRTRRDLPRIFVKETRLSAKPVQVAAGQQVVPAGQQPRRPLPRRSARCRRWPATSSRDSGPAHRPTCSPAAPARPPIPRSREWGLRHRRVVVSWTPGPRRALGVGLDRAVRALERRRALGRAGCARGPDGDRHRDRRHDDPDLRSTSQAPDRRR